MMKTAFVLAAGLMVLSCGSNTSSGSNASGNDVTEAVNLLPAVEG